MAIKSKECPRTGYAKLNAKSGRSYVVKTICKTWGCPVCRFKRASYVKAMMERGILMLGESFLITFTLRQGSAETHTVDFVTKAWTQLLRLLKRRYPNLTWFKVIEATKKGTPHLHVLMSGFPEGRIANPHKDRLSNTPWSEKFSAQYCKKDCLLHELSKDWRYLTSAFVVDVERVYNPVGAVRYLAKYLVKGFIDRARLTELGFRRRYSMARNWPRGEPLRLRGTDLDQWESIEISPWWYNRVEMEQHLVYSKDAYLLESVGDNLLLAQAARNDRRRRIKLVEDIKNNALL